MTVDAIWAKFVRDMEAGGNECLPDHTRVLRSFYAIHVSQPIVTPQRALWLAKENGNVKAMCLFLQMQSAPLPEDEDFACVVNAFVSLKDKIKVIQACIENQLWIDYPKVALPQSRLHLRDHMCALLDRQRPRPLNGVMYNKNQQRTMKYRRDNERKLRAEEQQAADRVWRIQLVLHREPPAQPASLWQQHHEYKVPEVKQALPLPVDEPVVQWHEDEPEVKKVTVIKIATGVKDSPATEDSKCVLCLSSAAIVTTVPCGHLCLCAECGNGVTGMFVCPICRADVDMVMATFKS